MTTITETQAWAGLAALEEGIAGTTLAEMFRRDPDRARGLSWELDGLWLDLSRQRITPEIVAALCRLAAAAELAERRQALFAGEPINATEGRAVLHPALRDSGGLTPAPFADAAAGQRQAFLAFADAVRGGAVTAHSGKPFTDAVAIGIGGSHLGPETVTTALADAQAPVRVHYVANADATDLAGTLAGLDLATTLFIVASKTFTTAETMRNAKSARDWLTAALGDDAVAAQFAAVSSAPDRAAEFGIAADRVFSFEDWVGGRFSLWSPVGLSTAIAIGATAFEQLLAGAHAMDRHFVAAPATGNLPVLLAVSDFWNRNFLSLPARAVLPYDERLRLLPAHLQQLEMESNGKGVTLEGEAVALSPAAVVFGMTGTNGQHTFHQMLHQGPPLIAAEFIGVAEPGHALAHHHDMLLANMLAQAEALALGSREGAVERHCPGDRPSSLIVLKRLDARSLGMLLALYEHKVFVEGVLAGVNTFDQFGVELGKSLAGPLIKALEGRAGAEPGPVSAAAVAKLKAWRG
ncbi:MAG: glucose-6-phosphate isomerase [Rhodospirillaceae bacterium]